MELSPNTLLQGGKYSIIKRLGQGGFGITYLGIQSGLERKVAIKEFFMKSLCNRDADTNRVSVGSKGSVEDVARFKEKFLKEARNLAKLNHPNIVSVIDVFEENDTAYYVMVYAEGGSLSGKVKQMGFMSETMATRYILQVAEALSYIHKRRMNHLDVKPANIMLDEDDNAILIDFGLSKQYDNDGHQTSSTPVGISEGYAPMEQYMHGGVGEFSPTTDVYALGATFYKLLTGDTPPNASYVNDYGLPLDNLKSRGVSQNTIDVICEAMKGSRKDRLQDAETFVSRLKGNANDTEDTLVGVEVDEPKPTPKPTPAPKSPSAPKPTPKPTPKPASQSSSVGKWLIIIAAALIGGIFILQMCNHDTADECFDVLDTMSVVDTTEYDSISLAGQDVISSSAPSTSTHRGHEYVDLGLPSGTKWATMNVGASSPSDYGNYYAWGETSTKSSYEWSNLKYCLDSDGNKFSKYVTDSKYGNVDGKEELDLSDDAANVNWGQGWRMPSKAQQDELREKCEWTWSSMSGHKGYKVVGPNGNSLFLPAAGYRNGGSSGDVGSYGCYRSRALDSSYGVDAYDLYFSSVDVYTGNSGRFIGHGVRPVLGF